MTLRQSELPSTGRATSSALKAVALIAIGAVMLGACSNKVKRQFGLLRTPPDEFAVVSKAPLSMPPDLTLESPRPGAESLSDQAVTNQARTAIFGTETGPVARNSQALAAAESEGERSLLGQAGAPQSDPNIRATIDRETAQIAEAEDGFLNRLMAYGTGARPDPNEVLVDPEGETRRIRENRALGKPMTEGETPEITPPEPRSFLEGVLQRILNNPILGQ